MIARGADSGAGASARHSMGTGVFGGMLAATFVGIIFVPALYSVFQRLREWTRGLFGKKEN